MIWAEAIASLLMLLALWLWKRGEFLFWQVVMFALFPLYHAVPPDHRWIAWHTIHISCIVISLRCAWVCWFDMPLVGGLLCGQQLVNMAPYALIVRWQEYHSLTLFYAGKVLDIVICLCVCWYCFRDSRSLRQRDSTPLFTGLNGSEIVGLPEAE